MPRSNDGMPRHTLGSVAPGVSHTRSRTRHKCLRRARKAAEQIDYPAPSRPPRAGKCPRNPDRVGHIRPSSSRLVLPDRHSRSVRNRPRMRCRPRDSQRIVRVTLDPPLEAPRIALDMPPARHTHSFVFGRVATHLDHPLQKHRASRHRGHAAPTPRLEERSGTAVDVRPR